MIFHKSILPLLSRVAVAVALLSALLACGDPKYHAPAIVVTFDPNFPPPVSINAGAYWDQGLAADVANDPKNGGVNFSCAPVGDCGSFNPTGAGSAVPTCYQAPETAPAGGTVTVTATSVDDPTKFVTSEPITITSGPPGTSCEP
jgi:hypothetical protein